MPEYVKYPKIHRLGKEEVEDILLQPVLVQEKIDGANCSIFVLDGELRCGTRTRMLPVNESFNGFQEFVREHEPELKIFFDNNPDTILYGEWLVKHTITYPDDAYRKVYLYDIFNQKENTWYPQDFVESYAKILGLEYPKMFTEKAVLMKPELIAEFVGKSFIGANGEGVVVKNPEFKNKFGDHVYAKVVHEKFKESNAIVFGGNNKHSEAYNEMYIINKYCTLGRVQKIMQKLQTVTEEKLDMKHTTQIAGTCYHDMITEEIWDIIKKIKVIDFARLQRLSMKKYVQIYHDILHNSVSIADSGKEKDVKDTDAEGAAS